MITTQIPFLIGILNKDLEYSLLEIPFLIAEKEIIEDLEYYFSHY